MKKLIEIIKRIVYNEKFILILFGIYVITTNIEASVLGSYNSVGIANKILRYSIYIIAIIKTIYIIIENKKINLRVAITVIFFSCIAIVSKNKQLLILIIIILLIRELEFKKIVKYCFYGNIIAYVSILLGAIMGLIPNWNFSRGNEFRYAYGYSYPSITSTYFFLLLLMKFYLKSGKIEIWEIALELLITGFIYDVTDSRMGLLMACIIIGLELILKILEFKKIKFKSKVFLKQLIIILPILVVAIIILLLVLYSKNINIAIKINKIMSDRLNLSIKAIHSYGIPLLGKDIKWYGWGGHGYIYQKDFEYNFVDIAYLKILFDYGLLFLILYILSYTMYMKKIVTNKERVFIIINILILIWGMIEPGMLEVSKNPFIILILSNVFNLGKIQNRES